MSLDWIFNGQSILLEHHPKKINRETPRNEITTFSAHHPGVQLKQQNGELLVSGETILSSYLHVEQSKNKIMTLSNQRWYRTGDKVIFLSDNCLEIKGRVDRVIKLSGRQIDLDEIERIIQDKKEVKEAVSIIDADEIIAFYVGSVDEKTLLTYLKKRLPFYMIPKKIMKLEVIPKTTSNKKDRMKLKKNVSARRKCNKPSDDY